MERKFYALFVPGNDSARERKVRDSELGNLGAKYGVLLKSAPAAPATLIINDTYCSGPRVSFFSGHMKISRRNAITML